MTKSFLTIMLNSNNDYSVWQNLSAQGHTSIDAFSLTRKYENEVIIFDWDSDVFIPRGFSRTFFFWRNTSNLLPFLYWVPHLFHFCSSFSQNWIKLALSCVGYNSSLSCTYAHTTHIRIHSLIDIWEFLWWSLSVYGVWDSAALFLAKTRRLCFQITKDLALFTKQSKQFNYLEKKAEKLYKQLLIDVTFSQYPSTQVPVTELQPLLRGRYCMTFMWLMISLSNSSAKICRMVSSL